ncbi:ribbon-helix-helix domain-containing protein [Marinobacter koreensis]|uniref:Ribbon-helix-helix domain-containing protein n=3 Tax=Marinobacter TaxID=2742 RepID=A0ABW0RPS9_9GAMM|nr:MULTISPECIES: ribbon-helix-helix domain-containing protein [Marinobacter]MBU2873841.1 ribbon-helix-helix domain-containing protein [Marinobacter salexigens]MCK7549032.1 ribbon-helix-helix domain-containing protein [Marinobacter koreensis]
MTTPKTTKKNFSLPHYIVEQLDDVSRQTGFSQSNLVLQALGEYLHRYEQDDTTENWMYFRGKCSGGATG